MEDPESAARQRLERFREDVEVRGKERARLSSREARLLEEGSRLSRELDEEQRSLIQRFEEKQGRVARDLEEVTAEIQRVDAAIRSDEEGIALMQALIEREEDAARNQGSHRRASAAAGSRDLSDLIRMGESETVEFKSSLRNSPHTGERVDGLGKTVIKAIAGLLNRDGGTLIIGVDDSGEAVGIEVDKFSSMDKMKRHLKDLVKDNLDTFATTLIRQHVERFDGKQVLRVDCDPSERPIYIRENGQQRYYVRSGASTDELSGQQLLDYIGKRSTLGGMTPKHAVAPQSSELSGNHIPESRRSEPVRRPRSRGSAGDATADLVCELLAEGGKPLHFRDIYSQLQGRELNPPRASSPDPAIAYLARYHNDERLVRVRRGTYALKESVTAPAPSADPRPRARDARPVPPGPEYKGKTPIAYTLLGERREVRSFKQILVEVCEAIWGRSPTEFEQVLDLRGRKRPQFSRNAGDLRTPRQVGRSGIFVETNESADRIFERCQQVLSLFGIDPREFTIEAR